MEDPFFANNFMWFNIYFILDLVELKAVIASLIRMSLLKQEFNLQIKIGKYRKNASCD